MTKLGLCLSGGGSKGAYEIGVYRALRRIKKNPEIVTGTSVGALNGLLIVQGDLYKSVKLWKNISFRQIYDENSFKDCDDLSIAEIYKNYAKSFIKEGGMDIKGLLNIFDEYYDSKKFFTSPIDYGLVTYNLTKHKPVMMTKKDLTPETVKDYVIASASCFPAFKPYKIKGDNYIDGGYYDNLPINLAVEMGADEIIAVDLRAVGFKRTAPEGVPLVVITPKNKIGSFLVFDKTKAKEAMHFGYNDTMKMYGKLDGDKFTFKKRNLVRNYNKYAKQYDQHFHSIFDNANGKIINKLTNLPLFKEYLDNLLSYKKFNQIVEKAGFYLDFPEDIIYNIKTYNKGLFNELLKANPIDIKIITKKIKNKNFTKILDKKQIVRFFYDTIVNNNIKEAYTYIPFFIDEFMVALYILITKGRKKSY
ncbi:MAG: patatin-like phospholipase family protein [Bacilli bacterium]|nr:patatin-like phospholipase family protein [Bacilli bacterium]